MSQHDYNIANQSGADFRADLNNALSAIATVNSGASEPSTTFAHQLWVDTSNNVLKIRNAANSAFITTGVSITASNTFAGALTGNATTATTLETARTINGTSFDGSANISFNTDSVAEGSSNLYFTNERVDDQVNALLQAGTGIQLTYDDTAGTLTIANTNDADITGVVAGNGLTGGGTAGSVTLNVAVDDSSIEIDSDALRVKASGITNTMLAGSIANSKLANSSVTINSQSLALGGTLVLDTDNIGEGSSNLYYTDARANSAFDTRLATKDTGDLSEGGNLYYTDARARAAISENSAQLSYNSTTGVLTYTQGDTDTVSEGSNNLYYTQARFDTAFGNKTTANLTENTNLYYTDTRANSAIDARVTNTFINNLSGVVADTSTALATARTIALSGDVVGSVSFDGTADVTIASTIQANSVALGTDTTGNYIQTVTGTANKITVSGSGSESADITLSLPDDVQIASDLTVAGNLTVNGTLTSLDTTNLDIEDNLFQLNAGLTGSPVNDSGMLINRGNQNNGIFMWDESVDKFTLGLTTADGSATGNITLSSLGTLVANLEGAVTGQVSDISNFTTANLTENTNLYYTQARFDSALAAKSTTNLSEGSNLYYTDARFDTRLASKDTDDVSEGTSNLYYTSARFNSAFSGKSTSDLSEGSNLYYTDARVQAVSINNVVEDTTPQLGGDLDLNSSDITGTGNINITGTIQSSGNITGTLATAAQPNITSLGTLTGLTTTGNINFGDNDKAVFGAGSDLQIYHDGSNSYIDDVAGGGTGDLYIKGSDAVRILTPALIVNNAANNEHLITAVQDGAVSLYHNGSPKIATSSSGVSVTGTANVDTAVGIGTSPSAPLHVVGSSLIGVNDFGSYDKDDANLLISNGNNGTSILLHDGSGAYHSSLIKYDTNVLSLGLNNSNSDNSILTGSALNITSTGVGIGNTSPLGKLTISNAAGANAPTTVTAANTYLQLGSDDYGASNNGKFMIGFGYTDATNTNSPAYIGYEETSTSGDTKGELTFYTRDVITDTAPTERLRIDSLGNVLQGTTTQAGNAALTVKSSAGSNTGIMIIEGDTNDGWGLYSVTSDDSFRITQYTHAGTYSDKLIIDSSGNVGIGISPSNTFSVGASGTVTTRYTSTDTSAFSLLQFENSGSIVLSADHGNSAASSNIIFKSDGGTERMRIDSSGNLLVGKTSTAFGTAGVRAIFNGQLQATADGNEPLGLNRLSSDGSLIDFYKDTSTVGSIGVSGGNNLFISGQVANHAGLTFATDAILPTREGSLTDNITDLGASSERFKNLYLSGIINPDALTNFINEYSATVANGAFVYIGSSGSITVGVASAASRTPMSFRNPNGEIGTISTQGSSTSYNTSSDYRLKENVVEMTGALDRVNQLQPKRFNFIADADTTVDGFLAHEVLDIVPEAIHGEKDAVDNEGNPEYQGIDQSKLVPLLTKAIQEQQTQIEALQSEINLLKGE